MGATPEDPYEELRKDPTERTKTYTYEELIKIRKDHENIVQQNEERKRDLEKKQAERIVKNEADRQAAKQKIEALKAQLETVNESYRKVSEKSEKANKDYNEAKEKHNDTKKKITAHEIQTKDEREKRAQSIKKHEEEEAAAKKRWDEAKEKLDAANEKLDKANENRDAIKLRRLEVEKECAEKAAKAQKELDELKTNADDAQQNYVELQKKADEATEKKKVADKHVENVAKRKIEMEAKHAKENAEHEKKMVAINARVDYTQKDHAEKQRRLEEAQNRTAQLTQKPSSSKDEEKEHRKSRDDRGESGIKKRGDIGRTSRSSCDASPSPSRSSNV